ncbi:hypothetical protein C8J55DRAFT_525066 [Lentinula edodes]|uniref:Uncharacterized protein n=1 Tax=Lentinula lateritia TaxID=40482 RepID=A0A9W8ZW45_9AGAR|nr:hypothetical protein C8J55DRAFT_525066 [Lentinula edodes]
MDDITQDNPTKRPNMDEVVVASRFMTILDTLPSSKLRVDFTMPVEDLLFTAANSALGRAAQPEPEMVHEALDTGCHFLP